MHGKANLTALVERKSRAAPSSSRTATGARAASSVPSAARSLSCRRQRVGPSPSTAARSSSATAIWPSTTASTPTSATRTHPGRRAASRTPMDGCAASCRASWTPQPSPQPTLEHRDPNEHHAPQMPRLHDPAGSFRQRRRCGRLAGSGPTRLSHFGWNPPRKARMSPLSKAGMSVSPATASWAGRAGLGWVTMSERDLQRVQVLGEVTNRRRTVASAAAVLALSTRQVHRLLKAYRLGGAGAIAHKARGRPSNNRIADERARPGSRAGALRLRRLRPDAGGRDAGREARAEGLARDAARLDDRGGLVALPPAAPPLPPAPAAPRGPGRAGPDRRQRASLVRGPRRARARCSSSSTMPPAG